MGHANREREAFHSGINNYVPGMAYASNLAFGQPGAFSLGAPAAPSATALDTDIDADGAVGLETTQSWTSDATYGRSLTMSMDADPGAAGGVYDVYGKDYLGQPMVERFTHANGSTAVIYGKKAFYSVSKVVNITAATNATTVNLGTGYRLGLPYKGDVLWAKEDNAFVRIYKNSEWLWRDMAGAQVAGGTSGAWVHTPFPGYIAGIRAMANLPVGSTNDPAITVELNTVAVTGLTVTVDVSAAATEADAIETDVPTTAGYSANNRFVKDSNIEIVVSDADGASALSVGVEVVPTQVLFGDLTDPATRTTGDPRGTYEPLMTMDGAKEIVIGLVGDTYRNASGNGGLHGIQHYHP